VLHLAFAVTARLHIGRMRRLLPILVASAACLRFEAHAAACPDCPTSRAVSAIVCGEGVWRNLALTVSPFVALGIVVWRLSRIGRPPVRTADAAPARKS
jgi:hypothetical protein